MKRLLAILAVTSVALVIIGLATGAGPEALADAGRLAVAAFLIGYLIDMAIFVGAVTLLVRWREKRSTTKHLISPSGPRQALFPAPSHQCTRYYGFIR